ncbi:NADPH-dependent F420 reductase [Streptomyces sp. NPDC001700]
MSTIGLIGSGLIGGTVARLAVAAGHNIVLSNRRGPDTLSGLVAELGPHARAATPAEAAAAGDIVIVTIPLHAYRMVPAEPLRGKIVIDTNNYYPERDSLIAALDAETTTTSDCSKPTCPTHTSSKHSTTSSTSTSPWTPVPSLRAGASNATPPPTASRTSAEATA